MSHENDSSQPSISIQLDLGEDLLAEKTVVLHHTDSLVDRVDCDPEDLLKNAKIFLNEGLIEDAKKALRQVLIHDSEHETARNMLDKIEGQELQRIIIDEECHRAGASLPEADEALGGGIDSESLIRQLDQDLGLNLFQNKPSEDGFFEDLEVKLSTGTVQDWIDVGIAFLELDCFTLAARLFREANRRLKSETPYVAQKALASTSLLVWTLMSAGKPFEALFEVQAVLQDGEVEHVDKIELFYLLGRIYETIEKMNLAQLYYQQVMDIDPHYRDVDQRMQKDIKPPGP